MVRLTYELPLGSSSKGYSFELVPNPEKDSDTYRKGLEIEESLKREEELDRPDKCGQ